MDVLVEALSRLRDVLNQHPLFSIGILLLVGYLLGKLAGVIKLPEITGFIVAGILMGESVTGVIPAHQSEDLKVVTEVALGLIAITIGGEFYHSKLKRLGMRIVVITVVQILATFLAVSIGLIVFKVEVSFALLLGAIATATAPAATVAIVQSLRAKGEFVDYLYGIVALDDAGSVIMFGLIFAVVSSILGGQAAGHAETSPAVHAVVEVMMSLVLGGVSGLLIHVGARKKAATNQILIVTLGVLFLSTAIAIVFRLSPLLANMAAGTVIINLSPRNHRIFEVLRPLTPPIYALFFVIAGTELQPELIASGGVLAIGLVYVLTRAVGKYGGVFMGAALSKTEPLTRNYLGLCMLPQAGVAIGLVLMIEASPMMGELAGEARLMVETMVNVVLFSVFVNELVGPPLSRLAVIRGNRMEV